MKSAQVKLIVILIILVAAVFLFQNCTNGFRSGQTQAQDNNANQGSSNSTVDPVLEKTDFLTDLDNPWDLVFTPDGVMLFTEKCRGLSVRRADGTVARLFGTTGSAVVASDIFCEGQSGVHGVTLDPDFASNRTVYLYTASTLSNPKTNRVLRLVVDAGYTTVSNRTDIITDIAFKNASNTWGGPGTHSGGRIRFGQDGYLYVTTGDNHNGPLPQDLTKLGGKVLRVDRTGAAAPGNNTPIGGDPRIFTYGHRNIQGIAFRPGTSQAFVAEHGPGHSDEVTVLVAGGNAGWDPKPEAGVSCADNYCGYISNKTDGSPTPMTDSTKFPNAMKPIWSNEGDSGGMGPCAFVTGAQWKSWNGRLLVGIMGDKRTEVLTLDSNNDVKSTVTADLPKDRVRSLVQGPDGNLYVATDEGDIWKVTPK